MVYSGRKIIDAKISEYGGKIFSTAGDSVVAEFASPVQCANAAMILQYNVSMYWRAYNPMGQCYRNSIILS